MIQAIGRFRPLGLCAGLLILACTGREVAPTEAIPPAADDVRHGGEPASPDEQTGPTFRYPAAPRSEVVDRYHGVAVPDPYRWLEAPDSPQTRAWVRAQNELTFGYLATIPEREAIRERLTALWDYERWGTPARHGPRYVVSRNDGLQNQAVLYTLERLDGTPRILLDPNALSADGTVALTDATFSPDGALMAYGVSDSGSDWETWRVREVATGKDRPDRIDWIKFSEAAWTADNRGFYYARYEAPAPGAELADVNEGQKVYYHRLGTPQADDVLVYARPDRPKWGFKPRVTDDGKYLVITVGVGTETKKSVFFQKIPRGLAAKGKARTVELLPGFAASYAFVGNDGPVFYFRTDRDAPRGRVVRIDTRKRPGEGERELIAEAPQTLRGVTLVGDRFFARYLEHASSRVKIFDLAGAPAGEVPLPGLGEVAGFAGRRGDSETFYRYTSFATPQTAYRFDLERARSEPFRPSALAFSPDDFVTEQVFYPSRDGTKIPMFISRHKDVESDGSTPTYLYGYGGFNIAITPSFSVPNLVWMQMGGLYAVANLRGGGEYGEAWHRAGTGVRKQNVFDDFIAAAQWLFDHGYTRPERLAIGGRSNGGLLVGATMTQRPDLAAVALPGVGVMDMLRFGQFTIGWAWESDYGSPRDPAQWRALHAYSPYHNLRPGTAYPATLVYTADHDDRVVPGHSYKFAAALQHAHDGPAPVMIRIDTKSGHGAGKPTAKKIEEWTDLWGFTAANLGMTPRWAKQDVD